MKRINRARLIERIETHAAADLASGRIGGCAVLVQQANEILFQNRFGDVAQNSLFRMASMTKPISTALTMQLVEQGIFGLDDPISRYLPEFEKMSIAQMQDGTPVCVSEAKTAITVRHLLTHTSGIGCDTVGDLQRERMGETDKATLENTVRYHAAQGLAFEPGTREAYSGLAAFDVLAAVIERVTGARYAELVQEKILTPCRMTDTAFVPSKEQWVRVIPMHTYTDGTAQTVPMYPGCVFENFPVTNPLAGAGLVSNLSDYANFAEMLLSGGVFEGKRILSEASVREMGTPQVSGTVQPGVERWGLGVRVIVGENTLPQGSFGWSGAYGTHFWVDPNNRIFAIYLKNSMYDNGADAKTSQTFEKDVYASLED